MYSPPVQFSRSVMSNSFWPHELQHARPPCPSPTPGAYSNSSPIRWWCHPTISSSVIPFSFCLQSFPASFFSNEFVLCIRWPKYWSFSFNIRPSNEYSGLISFRMDWLDGDNSNSQNATHSCLYCMFHWPCVWCSFCLEAYSLLCPLGQLSLKGLRLNM